MTMRALLFRHLRTPLYRNGYALVAGGASTLLLGVPFWLLAAHRYSTESLGVQSAVLAAMLVVMGIAQLAMDAVLVRFLPVIGQASGRLIVLAYGLAAVTAAVASLIFVLGTGTWSPALSFLRSDGEWLVAFVSGTVVFTTFILQDSALAGMRKAVWVPIENTLVSLARIGLVLALAASLPSAGIVTSWVISATVAVVVVNLLLFARLVPAHARSRPGSSGAPAFGVVARYALGNYAGAVGLIAATNLLPVMVINRAGPLAAAYFTVPWAIFLGLQLIAANLSVSLTVEAVLERERIASYARLVLERSLLLLVPVMALVCIAAPYLLALFGGAYASEGSTLLRMLAVAAIPYSAVFVAMSVARVQNRSWFLALLPIGMSLTLVGISYILLPTLGIKGVGIAALITGTLFGVTLSLTFLRRLARNRTFDRFDNRSEDVLVVEFRDGGPAVIG